MSGRTVVPARLPKDRIILDSYAKLNLYLKVTATRPDGYHNIYTVFERIDLRDRISLRKRRDSLIKIECSYPGLPADQRKNLAFCAAEALRAHFGLDYGVDIRIDKRIPVGSGMGGGSSNAAAVLSGLCRLWRLKINRDKLALLGSKIGSDVPFFLYDESFAIGSSRGERIKPLNKLRNTRIWHLIAVPNIEVSTERIYSLWDSSREARSGRARGATNLLTRAKYDAKILYLVLQKNRLSALNKAVFNSLQAVTCGIYPEVADLLGRMEKLRPECVMMSGSGPTVFGVFGSEKCAKTARSQLKRYDSSWKIFLARTI